MGYIYCITNLINSKKYVGKTTSNLKRRFREHCSDAFKERCEKRPLYDAMRKYGIENFRIQELEYVEDDALLSEREIYWINELETYGCRGYNATKGGDGSILYDHTEIIELYNLGYSPNNIANKMKCDVSTVYKVLKAQGMKVSKLKKVDQYDMAGNYIQTFESLKQAGQWLLDHGITTNKACYNSISAACHGMRRSAFKYKWRLHDSI